MPLAEVSGKFGGTSGQSTMDAGTIEDLRPLPAADVGGGTPMIKAILKNVLAVLVVGGHWYAIQTGYFSPDRPTRDQWERLEQVKKLPAGKLVYQSNFATETPGGGRSEVGSWGYYNGATVSTVTYDPAGVTVKYGGTPWIGAKFDLAQFEAQKIYRVTIDRLVEGEPAAVIIRNRLMDLERAQIPVGSGPFKVEFVAPRGGRDQIVIALIPDNRSKPQGTLRVTSLKIERLED